jgi:hypothetical protein
VFKSTKAVIVVGIIVMGILVTRSLNIYYLRDDNGGEILSRPNEAYLFMYVARRGYRVSYLEYPWVAFKNWARVPGYPSNAVRFLRVVKVTPSGIERHDNKVTGNAPDFYTPKGANIFANCERTLCKWAGDKFVNASPEEQLQFGGTDNLLAQIVPKIDGWSMRGVEQAMTESKFSVEIDKQLTIVVQQGNRSRSFYDSPTVDLYRNGQHVENLWFVDGTPRKVSRNEYEHAFTSFQTN